MNKKEIIFIVGILLFFNWFILTVIIKDHIDPEFLRYAIGFITGVIFARVVN